MRGRWFAVLVAAVAVALVLTACRTTSVAVEQGWSAPAAGNGLLYVGSRAGKLLAFTLDDKFPAELNLRDKNLKPKWQFPQQVNKGDLPLGAIYSQPVVDSTRVYIAMNRTQSRRLKGEVYALDRESGTEAWPSPFRTEGGLFGSIAADAPISPKVLFIGDDKGYMYAINASDGTLAWDRKVKVAEKRFWSSPTVKDGVLYIGSMDKKLYAVDAGSGKTLWSFKTDGAIASRPLVQGEMVYVGGFNRKFYAVNAGKCARGACVAEWSVTMDNWVWNDAVASKDGSLVYVASLGGTVYALDAKSGTVRWQFPTDSPVRADPLIVGENKLYIVGRNGAIFALDAKTGQERGSPSPLDAKALASPVWVDGFLYVHDMSEKLHKITAPAK